MLLTSLLPTAQYADLRTAKSIGGKLFFRMAGVKLNHQTLRCQVRWGWILQGDCNERKKKSTPVLRLLLRLLRLGTEVELKNKKRGM